MVDLLSLSASNATLEVRMLSMNLKLFQLKRKYEYEHQPEIFYDTFKISPQEINMFKNDTILIEVLITIPKRWSNHFHNISKCNRESTMCKEYRYWA